MKTFIISSFFFVLLCTAGYSQTAQPELWYWHHSFLNSTAAVQSSMALIDRAQAAGYTGVSFWDVNFEYLNDPQWPSVRTGYLQQVMNYALSKNMKVLAQGAPFGYSNDVLNTNPNWAEGQRVVGALFKVNASATQLTLVNSNPGVVNGGFESGKTSWFQMNDSGVGVDGSVSHGGGASGVIRNQSGNGRFTQLITLTPWRQYHIRMFAKTSGYSGAGPAFEVFDVNNSDKSRVYKPITMAATQDWTQFDATFNSQDSTQAYLMFGEWGGSSGTIWFDDVSVEETGLVYLVRRAGTPLKVYDPSTGTVFQEGKDYNFVSDPLLTADPQPQNDYHTPPTVTLPGGTSLAPGQIVAIDFYAIQPSYSHQLGMCLTEAGVQDWLKQNAQTVTAAVPADAGYFLQYDEMRQMNSCDSCRKKGLTAGQLLAWHVGQTINLYQSLRPNAPLYVWNDMFDPYANAHDNYYQVEGDLSGSYQGLPSNVTIMNWNLPQLKNSLQWFSGQNAQQPVPHDQIIAGYYDTGDGAAAATSELQQALGIPGVKGLMYTTWNDDYTQLGQFATAAKAGWASYQASLPAVAPAPVVSISLSPKTVSVQAGQSLQFTAAVAGNSNHSTSWTLTPQLGSLVNGLYTAPASLTSTQSVTVTATSAADSSKSASALVTLTPTPQAATLTPAQTSVAPGATLVVNWSAPAGHANTDWIALFPVGGASNAYLTGNYTGFAPSGSFGVVMPSKPGQYEFRYLINDSLTSTAASAPITINAPASSTPKTRSITPSQFSVTPGQTITVNWTAPAGHASTDWIALYQTGTPNTAYLSGTYSGSAASGSFTLTMPAKPGQYEFRFLLNDSLTSAAPSNPITVGSTSAYAFTVPSSVSPGQTITVNWTAPAGHAPTDWIALYQTGTPNTAYLSGTYSGSTTSGSFTFTMPVKPGQYEFRFLLNDSLTPGAASSPISVGSISAYSITVPASLNSGQTITVNWTAPAGHAQTDWIALYQTGTPNTAYLSGTYSGAASSGSFTLTMPAKPGQYEFRFLLNDGLTSSSASNPITVH